MCQIYNLIDLGCAQRMFIMTVSGSPTAGNCCCCRAACCCGCGRYAGYTTGPVVEELLVPRRQRIVFNPDCGRRSCVDYRITVIKIRLSMMRFFFDQTETRTVEAVTARRLIPDKIFCISSPTSNCAG